MMVVMVGDGWVVGGGWWWWCWGKLTKVLEEVADDERRNGHRKKYYREEDNSNTCNCIISYLMHLLRFNQRIMNTPNGKRNVIQIRDWKMVFHRALSLWLTMVVAAVVAGVSSCWLSWRRRCYCWCRCTSRQTCCAHVATMSCVCKVERDVCKKWC